MKLIEGPREKIEKYGIESLSNDEVLAVILKVGTKQKNVFDLSKEIIRDIMNIKMLNDYSYRDLLKFLGIGKAQAMSIICAIELSKRIKKENENLKKIKTPFDLVKAFENDYIDLPYEKVGICFMDQNYRLLFKYFISNQLSNCVELNIKDIIKRALKLNASYVGLIHNHPSEIKYPSVEDIEVTNRLDDKLNEFGIVLFDSIVITNESYFSINYSDKPKSRIK